MMDKIALVAIGGAGGAVMRYLFAGWVGRAAGAGFMGTMAVNVLGSFLMGVFAVVLMERFPGSWARLSPLVVTGILGGFTTFSAFSLDAVYLLERGRPMAALGYIGGSVLFSLAGLLAGLSLARAVQ